MVKKISLEKGCVFAVPLDSDHSAIGQVIYIDHVFPVRGETVSDSESDCLYVNIRAGCTSLSPSSHDIDDALKTPIIFKGFMRDVDIRRKKWKVLDRRAIPNDVEVEEVLQTTPEGFVVENLHHEFLRDATQDDLRELHYRRYRLSIQIGKEIKKLFRENCENRAG